MAGFADLELFPLPMQATAREVPAGISDLSLYNTLHPLEQALVAHSVERRKAEFGDARWCAHQSLRQLGHANAEQPILRGARGMPLWPTDVAGTIAHTEGLRVAAVVERKSLQSIGIDVEPAEPLPKDVLAHIARVGELPHIDRLRGQGIRCADRILFCAKEATYKAWFPITHRWLGFEHAEVDLRADGTFISYILQRPTPVPFIQGRWMNYGGHIVATAFVPYAAHRRYLRI